METFDGHVQLNRYDAEGLRYEMEENGNLVRFIFNPDREAVVEEDGTGLARLIRGTELIARSTDAARTYYHYASDEMGSTTHIVDDAGHVQNRYEYDAWGNLTVQEEAIPNRFKYTGQQLDLVTQQYYLRARFYNPVIARFTQEDTYRGDGLNLYAYCANNPVFYVDPTGNYRNCVKDAYDRIRKENPEISATDAYKKAKDAYGFGVEKSAIQPAKTKADTPDNKPTWWHEGYVDNLSDLQIILGVKESRKGLSTLGSAPREDAMRAGLAWVGDNYKEIVQGEKVIGYASKDGMRAFRIQYKNKEGMWRANFQENMMVSNIPPNKGQHSSELKNVHIDILD